MKWDTRAIQAILIFGRTGEDGSLVVRPALYSYGGIRLLPLEQMENAAVCGKLGRWDISSVSKMNMTLDSESISQEA